MESAPEKRGSCLWAGLRIVGILIVVVIGLGLIGLVYESQAEARVLTQYPAPGQLVEINGRKMHIHCTGEGNPTIILDAGQGGWSSDWGEIIPELSRSHRVCAYDRAGYGWSDPAQDTRSPQQAADDLLALLTASQVEAPYVLVAFSHSGLANRLLAAQQPDLVAGMVLIDPATEFDNEIMSADLMQQQRSAVGLFQGFTLFARLGLVRWLGAQSMAGYAPFIATQVANPEIYYTFVAESQWWNTSTQEFVSRLDDAHLAHVRDHGPIPDIPLIIIGAETLDSTGNSAMQELQTIRNEKLRTLAAQSSEGEFIVAEESTHNVLTDRPDVVIDAILRVVQSAKG
jgi:pimeloyl-ACP methyl ester carboxylesterase